MVNNADAVLEFEGGHLRISRHNDNWWRVSLFAGESTILLGGQTYKYLQEHLVPFLTDPPTSISWVVSFFERHYSVYGASDKEGGVDLMIQDALAKPAAELHLTDPERRRWLESMEKPR